MLKFRYLFNNQDLAEMLVKNWEHDSESLELFKYFRISANAIYPFKKDGESCFLRFRPLTEKGEEILVAELEFLKYLRYHGYPVVEIVDTKEGSGFVRKETPWGEYTGCVFRQMPGKQISQTSFDDEVLFAYGSALGELHALSKKFEPIRASRWSHTDVMDWMERELSQLASNSEALDELVEIRKQLSQLPQHNLVYGLIHYDFEPDNVFFDESNYRCSVIDFDDAMYHWYVMDIVQALAAIKDELSRDDISHQEKIFLEGYNQKFILDSELLNYQDLFRRFARLYQYTRVRRAMGESWENEPSWMVNLREQLSGLLFEIEEEFQRAQSQFST